jgi:hypothetical protein
VCEFCGVLPSARIITPLKPQAKSMEEIKMFNENKKKTLRTDENMLKKILIRECGDCETDEFAADELEVESRLREQSEEFASDNPEIGESEYFSTCNYTMVTNNDDDLVDYQGS